MNKAHLVSWSGVSYMITGFTRYELDESKRKLILYFKRYKMRAFNLREFFFWEIKEDG